MPGSLLTLLLAEVRLGAQRQILTFV